MLCYQQTYLHSYAAWIALPLLGGTSLANDPVDYPCQDRPRGVQNHLSWQPSWLFLLPNLPWSGVWSESGFRTLCDSVVGVLGDSSFLRSSFFRNRELSWTSGWERSARVNYWGQQGDPYLLQKTCSVGLCHCSILLVSLQKPTSSARETTPETSLIDYIYELQISPYFPNKGTGSRGEKEWPYKMTLLKSMSGSPFKMG